MEKKRTLYSLESDIRKILEDNDFVSTGDEGGKQWYMNLITDLAIFVQQELEKAREELADEVAREIGYGKLSGEEHYKTLNRVIKLISKLKDNK